MDGFRRIMGAIVLLFSPLSSASLAKLICFENAKVKGLMVSLQSVVSVPKDSGTPIELLHLSFREFLVDCSASEKFWINEPAGHTQLGRDCLGHMNQELKMNICHLSHPGVKKNKIEKATLDTYIPPELRYACRYWIHHLQNGEPSTIDWTLIEHFLKSHFLHWLEVMSLFGWVSEIFDNIKALEWLQKVNHSSCEIKFEGPNGQTKSYPLADFLYDAKRFILKNRQIVDEAPLQIYYAGLIFAPQAAIIREMFQSERPKWICQLPQVQENWSAELQVLEGHTDLVQSVAFSSDGQLLASGSDDNTIQLWDPVTGALQQTLKGHTDYIRSVAFSPDSQLLASGSSDKTVQLWDPATGTPQKMLEGHTGSVQSVAFSPDNQLLASGSDDKTVQLWDPATGTPKQTLKGHTDWVRSVAFSPNGQLLASGSSDKRVWLWNLATGTPQKMLEGHTGSVRSVAFSPDGQLLASGSDDNTIQLWDPATGAFQQILKGHTGPVYSVVFSPDGQLLASGSSDKTIQLWDPATNALQKTLKGHTDWVRSVAFSPDGQLLASSSDDKTVQLWDPATGAFQQKLKGHTSWVSSVAFSPNSQLLASGSNDNTVRLWDPATGALMGILNTKGCVMELKFSQDGSYLSTSLGSFTIQSSCGNPTLCSPGMGWEVSLQDEWIAVDGNQVLWLPPEARCSCSATKSNTLALGHKSGRVSFIGFAK